MTLTDKIKERIDRVVVHGWNKLDLSNCGLSEIPDWIFDNCADVSIIDLSNDTFCLPEDRNTIGVIHRDICKLKKLARLNLANNQISEINESLGQLQNLRHLNLSNNKIKYLPPQVANLPKLEELFLEGNPFDLLPPEIVARGRDSIRNFIKELDVSDFLYEAKLIIVGEGRVGKTCLSNSLIHAEYVLEDEPSTEGINILTWTIDHATVKLINPEIKRDLTINIWDFGGQEIYHSTHQFFLTKRAIYLLVTESRKEDRHEDFYYWLNIIKILGDDSPVLMVLNKCDEPNKELPFREFQDSFSNLKKFYKVSLMNGHRTTFDKFKTELIELTSKLPHIGTALPKVWVDIRIELERLKNAGTNYISEVQYLAICKKHYRDFDGAMFLSDYFHDLGVILHFRDDIELKDTVFLNHEWITKGVYKILDDPKVIEQKGRFSHGDIIRIWSDDDYREKMSQLLFLMRNKKFDLCFELDNGDFIVPRLLPVDEVDVPWTNEQEISRFEIRYKFMPKGILSRLIVKMNQDIHEDKYWRYGVLLKYDGAEALVRERYFDSKITIALRGDNRKEFLAIIRKQILQINKDFKRLKCEEMIQCICADCTHSRTPYFHSYDLLRRCEQKGIASIMCNGSLLQVSVAELMSDILASRISVDKLIYCENKNAELLNALDIANVSFVSEKDSNGVFTQTKSRPDKYGLRDRDFLLDSEVIRLRRQYPNYYILEYYCFENYLYHPANIAELGINNLNLEEYVNELIRQKNENREVIISNFKQARKSYFELKVDSEKIYDKENENDIIKYLNSDEVEVFFKAFSVKTYFKRDFISKYLITQKELSSTEWFKGKILELIDPK
jgi:small GTP-binding protein